MPSNNDPSWCEFTKPFVDVLASNDSAAYETSFAEIENATGSGEAMHQPPIPGTGPIEMDLVRVTKALKAMNDLS